MFGYSSPCLSLLAALPLVAASLSSPAQAQGGALLFDGVDDRCTILDLNGDFDLGSSMTLEAWVRFDSHGPSRGFISSDTDSYSLFATNDQAAMYVATPSSENAFEPNTLPEGVWTHMAGTYDGAEIRIYVNGVLEATQSKTG